MIPEDLLPDIFLYLPIKSLMRCKCVSKSWHSLITDNRFTMLYDQQHTNTIDIMLTRDIFYNPEYSQCFYSLNSELCEIAEDLSPSLLQLISNPEILVVGSCNGLLCLSDYFSMVALWNPTTREFVRLPNKVFPELCCIPDIDINLQKEMLLGFGCYINDEEEVVYKVIAPILCFRDHSHNFTCSEIMVYTIGGEPTWRRIQDKSSQRPYSIMSFETPMVDRNGVLHWVGALRYDKFMKILIATFDLKTEKLGEVASPDIIYDVRSHYFGCTLGVIQGCLCISFFSHENDTSEVWVMKNYGAKESWSRLFSIERDAFFLNTMICRGNGDNLITVDEGGKDLIVYDPVNERNVSVHGLPALGLPTGRFIMTAYVKSILSIASLMRPTSSKGVKEKKRRRVQQTAN